VFSSIRLSKREMTIEQAILAKVRSLQPDKQQELLNFAESLVQESQAPIKRQWSPEFLSTFGAWEGELIRAPQEEQTDRQPLE
jgi:hypothetical protein